MSAATTREARLKRLEAAARYQGSVARVGSSGSMARIERRAAERALLPRPVCVTCGHEGRAVRRLPEPEERLTMCSPCQKSWRANNPRPAQECELCGVRYYGSGPHPEAACLRARARAGIRETVPPAPEGSSS
jgi:hypothetical protein